MLVIKRYGRMSLYLRVLRLFLKKRIYDPYEVEKQVHNIKDKGYEINSDKFWTQARLKQEKARTLEVIR